MYIHVFENFEIYFVPFTIYRVVQYEFGIPEKGVCITSVCNLFIVLMVIVVCCTVDVVCDNIKPPFLLSTR